MIRALLMDADGVMQQLPTDFFAGFAELGGSWDFVDELFSQEQRAMTGKEDLKELLTALIARHGLSITPEELLVPWCQMDLDQRMLDLVARARQAGIVTALATNQQSYRGAWMQQNLPYADYFDHTFYSFEIGLAKPDPAYFTHIIDQLGIAANEAVFVDDLSQNTAAARSAGLKAVTYPSRHPFTLLGWRLRALGVRGV